MRPNETENFIITPFLSAEELRGICQTSCRNYGNYLVPYIAAVVWGIFEILAIIYGAYKANDYRYPDNPSNPQLASNTLSGIIPMAILGASTIPIAGLWTIGRALTRFDDTGAMIEIFRRSVAGPLGAHDAIILNTLAAPFATPIVIVVILSGYLRPDF